MRKVWIVVSALCLLAAMPAEAQNRRASGEIGIYAGYRVFDADIEDDATFGVHAGVNFTDRAEVEVRWERTETEIEGTIVDVDLDSFMIGFVWNYHPDEILTSPHVPFFTIGLGRTEFDLNLGEASASFQDDFDFIYLGVGYRYFWNDFWAFRGDVRAYVYGDDGDLGETDQVDWGAAVGVSVVFGGS